METEEKTAEETATKRKRRMLTALIAAALLVACGVECALNWRIICEAMHPQVAQAEVIEFDASDNLLPSSIWEGDGYDDFGSWCAAIMEVKEANENVAGNAIDELGDYLTNEEIARLQEIESMIADSMSLSEIDSLLKELCGIVEGAQVDKDAAEAAYQQQVAASYYQSASSYSEGSDPYGFKNAGVVYDNGLRYTWYSSNVLYHYRTGEWTAGDDGLYRDSNGNIIIASSDYAQGTLVDTPWGQGIVADSGCASGTIDVYTNY